MSKFCNNDITLKMKYTRKAPDIELDKFKEYHYCKTYSY